MDKGGYGGVLSLDTANSDSFAFFANKQQPLILKRKSMDNLGFSMRIEDNGGRDVGPKKRVDEVDFFSDEKKKKMKMECSSDYTDLDLKVAIKKEDYLSINTNLHLLTANTSSNQSMVDDGLSPTEEDIERQNELAVMQSELVRMKEENQKLKGVLSQVTTNYNALQMHLLALKQQRAQRNSNDLANNDNEKQDVKKHERQFMDLGPASVVVDGDEPSHSSTGGGGSLNRSSSTAANNGVNNKEMSTPFDHERSNSREGSPDQGSQDWAPNKQAKLVTSSSSKGPEQAQEATMRKARVSVRARSEAPMISDGCQWRKYGQKMAKGNPCPRAYYRCTMATGCPVRKQVQRCVDDRTILITTYEGNHNHPLPPAAMAMASTTSAAASMLLSGSMSSSDGLVNPTNFLSRTIVPCSSTVATISASAPFPTITLDLTQTNPQNPLQFPILRPPAQLQLNSLPQVFGQVPYSNQSKFSGLQMSQEVVESGQFGQPKSLPGQATNSNLADTVSAATAAITADPNFTVALTAAIKSIIAGGNSTNGNSSSSTRGNGKESNKTAGSSCFPS